MKLLSDGRVRRSRLEWREMITRHRESGLSEVAFCKREKLSRQNFRTWKRRLADELEAPGFVELAPSQSPAPEESGSRDFELSLPGGVTIRWSA